MKNGNHAKGFNKKSIALVAAVALMLVGVVGGTIAWLTAETGPVTNTFTASNVAVELKETTTEYKMVPGCSIAKDPKVTVTNDVDAYVFVEITESTNFDTYMKYSIAEGWIKLEEGVYYREVAANEADTQGYAVLNGNKVTVLDTVDKDDMAAANTNAPTLTFTAYIIQKANGDGSIFTPAAAWEEVSK